MVYDFVDGNIDNRFCQFHQSSVLSFSRNVVSIDCNSTQDSKEANLDKAALTAYLNEDGQYNDALCNVFRAGITSKQKTSSYGFLATFLSCSVIVGFTQ